MQFNELKDLLKKELGIERLADIAREIGVSPQAVSNWKSRNRVPYKYVRELREKFYDDTMQNNNKNINEDSKQNIVSIEKRKIDYLDEDTVSIIDLLLVIARNIKIIIMTTLFFCFITILYSIFVAQPVYKSTAKIMSSSGGNNVSQAAGFAAQFGINLPTNQAEPEWVYSEIIKSRTLARSMLKRKFDTKKFGTQKSLLQILTYGNNDPTYGQDTLEVLAINSFINKIELLEDQMSGIYTITIGAFEPEFVKELIEAHIEELDKHQRDYNKARTSETRKFIENRIIDTKFELENAEEELKNFNNRNRRIENSPALQLERQRLAREVSVLTGVFTILKQQLETAKIEEVKESEYVIVLDPPEIPLGRSEPKRKNMVFIAAIFGICVGAVISLFKEYIVNTQKDDSEKMNQLKYLLINNIYDLFFFSYKKDRL